jgi:hypothetical protein
MATDVSRVSFDPARLYTRVLPQQGRVLLEAEDNEDGLILAEERRHELLDLVGPAATPDDGYALSSSGPGRLTIGPGTMYVGGNRVRLDAPIEYDAQPDWLDHEGDPDWSRPPNVDHRGGVEHVVLQLIERDVTAVEDPVLREVALGGPDGAARARTLQRVRRMPARARDCDSALNLDVETWAGEGLVFDPATAALASDTRLLVTWDAPVEPPDPCEPSAQGGYLGADNQAIRVQVVRRNPDRPDVFDLVWGWDDASMLYRVSADASVNPILTLQRSPVDDFHRPRAGQAVQVLRSAAALASTDGVVEGYAASINGAVAVLTAPYDPDRRTVTFPHSLAAEFTDPGATPQLYLRVWEELLTDVRLGDEVALTGTGLKVTLTLAGGATTVHPGDFWVVGVRPATPETVLPARLLRTPQPPDGPRMWACPLAVIAWEAEGIDVLDDCRVDFDPLPAAGGCCTITVGPRDARRLQALIDRAVAHRPRPSREHRVTVCFRPGQYRLPRPLVLGPRHGHVHLEGCGEGVLISAARGRERAFLQGLFTLVHADNVRLSGFEFEMPQVPGSALARELKSAGRAVAAALRRFALSVAVRPVHCAELEIDRCLFRFTLGPGTVDPDAELPADHSVFGVGVFAGSECWGLTLTRNRFLHDTLAPPKRGERAQHTLVGVLLAPTQAFPAEGDERRDRLTLVRTILERGRFVANEFHGLSLGVFAAAQLGEVRVQDNVVLDCHGGVWLLNQASIAMIDRTSEFRVRDAVSGATLDRVSAVLRGFLDDRVLRVLLVLGQIYPLPAEHLALDRVASIVLERKVAKAELAAWMKRFVADLTAPFAAPDAPDAASGRRFSIGEAGGDLRAAPLGAALERAFDTLAEGDRALAVATPIADVDLRLRVSGNDIDCASEARGADSGMALLALSGVTGGESSAVITGNRMTGRPPVAVAAVAMVPVVTADANVVRNANPDAASLALVGCREIAVTGNVVRAPAVVPPRPLPPPLDSWAALNTGM